MHENKTFSCDSSLLSIHLSQAVHFQGGVVFTLFLKRAISISQGVLSIHSDIIYSLWPLLEFKAHVIRMKNRWEGYIHIRHRIQLNLNSNQLHKLALFCLKENKNNFRSLHCSVKQNCAYRKKML